MDYQAVKDIGIKWSMCFVIVKTITNFEMQQKHDIQIYTHKGSLP